MALTFLRIETRGGNLVAVFDRGYQQWYPTGPAGGYYDDGTFCLNESSLKLRIANIERRKGDTSVEQHALTTMSEIQYHQRDEE